MADIKTVIVQNYMPYAKGTIISRAIPTIDGFKPVNRRILYTMYKMGLQKNKSKCANIVGAVMKFHPHGDSAIYEALVRMSTGHQALNVPYITSKGNFGKIYSDEAYAAYRYTEAGLESICQEIFEGIDENAVDFIPNYDNTDKEPVLLPVKFPNILVNTSSGIAVGMSSSIPSFGLKEVCSATVGILEGKITNTEELMNVLGAPEFPTGGFVHGDISDYLSLGETGRGSITVSSSVDISKGVIVVREIPYKTTVDAIKGELWQAVKEGDIKEIADIRDESDIDGLRLVIELKRGADERRVIKKINRYSKMVMKISFITRVIINDRPRELGLLELLNEWINFRMNTIQRIYSFRLNKKEKERHLLETWEKIADNIKEIATMIASKDEDDAEDTLINQYGLDELQANYLMDMRVKDLTENRLAKKIKELNSVISDITVINSVLSSDDEKKKIIISELKQIENKYGDERKTIMTKAANFSRKDKIEEQIEDISVSIVVTKGGYMKRLMTINDELNMKLHDGDEIQFRVNCSNKDTLLIFTYDGVGHKIPAHYIESGRGIPKDNISNILEGLDMDNIMYITNAGDYKGSINIVGEHGRGMKLRFSRLSGPRNKYKGLFEGGTKDSVWCTNADKFFVITKKRRAAYVDVTPLNTFTGRSAFKAARILSDDRIFGLQPLYNVPDKDIIDLERYSKGYCVKIKDVMW